MPNFVCKRRLRRLTNPSAQTRQAHFGGGLKTCMAWPVSHVHVSCSPTLRSCKTMLEGQEELKKKDWKKPVPDTPPKTRVNQKSARTSMSSALSKSDKDGEAKPMKKPAAKAPPAEPASSSGVKRPQAPDPEPVKKKERKAREQRSGMMLIRMRKRSQGARRKSSGSGKSRRFSRSLKIPTRKQEKR